METPLPKKIEFKEYDAVYQYTIRHTINQLIDCLAELTKIVEGKQDMVITSGLLGEFAGFERDETPAFKGKETPSLKETLLKELRKAAKGKPEDEYEKGYDHGLMVAKMIINRLMP